MFTGSTNADMLRYVRELKDSLSACNIDKATLRVWLENLNADRVE